MTDHDPLRALWLSQRKEPFTMSIAELQSRATRLQNRVRTRNLTEYAAGVLVVATFGWMALIIPAPLAQAGAVLVIAGVCYALWKLHRLAHASDVDPASLGARLADFHRDELRRQRRALASVWRWYLAPLVPGVVVFASGVSLAPDTGLPIAARLAMLALSLGVVAAVFGSVVWLNRRAVRRLDREIGEVEELMVG